MIMRRNKLKRIMTMLLAIIMLAAAVAPMSYAYEAIDMDREATLSVEFTSGPKVSGMEFRAYRVASVDAGGHFEFTEAIASYGLSMPNDQAGYRALAETLAAYVARDGITADAKAVTNADGRADFGKLDKGLYLVLADPYKFEEDGMTYFASPSLVALPTSVDGSTWVYDVTVSPKYTSVPPIPSTGTTEINVIKVWSGEANADKRPTYVYAELICEGKVLDTVTLNSGNNWRHTWTELPADKTYTVTEKQVPEGYTVTITRDGNTFTMNNYKGDVPPKTPPKTPRLPQTGQLWWPVPVLAGVGLLLFIIGSIRKKSAKS